MSLVFFYEIGVEELSSMCVCHAGGITGFDRNGNERKGGERMAVGEQCLE